MENGAGPGLWTCIRTTVPTREGQFVVSAGSALLLGALVSGRTSLYLGASLLLALYVVAHLGAAFAARCLDASWECPSRVFAGEPFPLRLVVRNRGPVRLEGIEVHEPPPVAVGPAGKVAAVEAGRSAPLEVRGSVRRRGLHRLAAPSLRVRWPLLLAESERPLGGERDVLAYPRRVPVPSSELRSAAPETAPREAAAAALRGGTEFRGVREWAPGDPPRAIAWRASARHGKVLTREFEREDAGRVVVALDADVRDLAAALRSPALEAACSKAASLLLRLRAAGRRTVFATYAPSPVYLPSVASERALGRALESLALLVPPSRKEPRRDPLALVPRRLLRGSRVLVVRAGTGASTVSRRRGGGEVVTLPSIRAAFEGGRQP